MAEQYTYAVARIRAKELTLLSKQAVEQLLACHGYDECIRALADMGWGGVQTAEAMLAGEQEKTWALMHELVPDLSAFEVFLWPIDFNNLKAAIKAVITDVPLTRLFSPGGAVPPEVMVEAVRRNDFSGLPVQMRAPGQEAYLVLLQAHDGQMCDVILDKAALGAILDAGKRADSDMLLRYAELTVAIADIKIAVRSVKTGKSGAFLRRALVPCGTLEVSSLAAAADRGMDELCAYLAGTAYSHAVDALKISASAFEKWCGDTVMDMIRGQKTNPFGIGPLAAYILARDNEIKTARVILSGKLNHLPDTEVRERLGEMYV